MAHDDVAASQSWRRGTMEHVADAMQRHRALSINGLTERVFTAAFSGLVYPQIWEDPDVDIAAMQLEPGHRVIAIASGGCNVLSYLTAQPLQIIAVDLNAAHVALNRLKLAAVAHLDDAAFDRMFRDAADASNVAMFDEKLSPFLDADTLAYWSARDWRGRRRIDGFRRGFYRQGLLGRFIDFGHRLARLFGVDPSRIMQARTIEEQRRIFDADLKPLFEKPLVRRTLASPASLFGLGIPPAQYAALSGGRAMHEVVLERLERLACGFALSDNYFAWQAFERRYPDAAEGPLPPYLKPENFALLKQRVGGVTVLQASFEDVLSRQPSRSLDRYVLLDAQDWMTDGQLNGLWREITRTARPGARVIFRTAAPETLLPGRVRDTLLDCWVYQRDRSAELTSQDRSAIYGGFHIYERAA